MTPLDDEDREVLDEILKVEDEPEPSWKDPKWAYVLMVGGLVLAGIDILVDGEAPDAGSGFMFAAGLFSALISVPVSRRVWRCHRLIRHAGKKAFTENPRQT